MASSEPSKAEIATAAGMPTHDTVYSKPGDQGIHNPILETVSETVSSNKPDKDGSSEDDTGYLKGYRLVCMVIGLALAVFCMGLDRTILAAAIPRITTDFNSLDDIAWYGSSYLLTTCCFQLWFGKFYVEFSVSWVFLVALAIFELGSIVCATAPSSLALIIGRAIAGIGCAGILSGAFIIIARSLPLQKRPVYTGIIGGIAGISQVLAPTLGGAFTDHVSWRWCFWINLPCGAISAIAVFLFVHLPGKSASLKEEGFFKFVDKLDPLGTALLMPFVICLLLALQWGGSTYPWSNWRIILCLCLFAILFLAWIFVQYCRGNSGVLPLRIARHRSVASGMLFMLGLNGAIFIIEYYVAIWFQAVKNTNAQQSGINLIAFSVSFTVSAMLSGGMISKMGYYVPLMIASTIITSIASGLIFRYNLETSTAYWAGTLVMFGFGGGLGMQVPLTAVQTVLADADIPLGTSALILTQTITGAIFLPVGQNLFQSKLVHELNNRASGVDPAFVIAHGASGLKTAMTQKYGPETALRVLEAYNEGLRQCFLVCVILASLNIIATMTMEWKSVKTKKQEISLANDNMEEQEKTL